MKRKKFRRKKLTVEEINAYKTAYEAPLGKRDYVKWIVLPALFMGSSVFFLLYHWFLFLLFGLIGALYGRFFLLPKLVIRQYNIRSLQERNRVLNIVTHVAQDPQKIPLEILERTHRVDGKIKRQLQELTAELATGMTEEKIRKGFYQLTKEYREDVVFCQYIDQLQTRFLLGRANQESLIQMNTHHNLLVEMQGEFLRKKRAHLKDCLSILAVVVIGIGIMEFGFGFSTFVQAFSHSFIGLVTSVLYLSPLYFFVAKFVQDYFDDSIQTVKARVKQ